MWNTLMGNLYLCLKAVMTVIHIQCIAIAIAMMKMRGKPWTAITSHHYLTNSWSFWHLFDIVWSFEKLERIFFVSIISGTDWKYICNIKNFFTKHTPHKKLNYGAQQRHLRKSSIKGNSSFWKIMLLYNSKSIGKSNLTSSAFKHTVQFATFPLNQKSTPPGMVNCVILTRHTACHDPPDVTILRMYICSESLFHPFPKRLALRMPRPALARPAPPLKKRFPAHPCTPPLYLGVIITEYKKTRSENNVTLSKYSRGFQNSSLSATLGNMKFLEVVFFFSSTPLAFSFIFTIFHFKL